MTTIDAQRLADFCHGVRFDALPDDVQTMARTLLVDTLGCLVGGLQYPEVQRLGRRLGGRQADGFTAVPFTRLLTWGAAATWLDADSGGSFHPRGDRMPPVPTAHPAPHVVPVLLHHAASDSPSDADLLTAFVAAIEIGMRFGVGSSLRPGFHPHGVHGPVAAAVAQALLTGMDRQATANAILLGLSQPLAATLMVPMRGGTVRNVWTGLGTFLGAQAAQRAASGAVGEAGTAHVLFDAAICTDLDLTVVEGGLGTRWHFLDSYLKPYACGRWIHPTLDAFTAAVVGSGRHCANLDTEIAAIDVSTFAFAASLDTHHVDSDMHARFSVPTCLAALAVHGQLVADTFLPERLPDPRVEAVASRVSVVEDPAFTAVLPAERPASVTVTWRDGSSSTGSVRNARGNPQEPLSLDEVEHKFRQNVGTAIDASQAIDLLHGRDQLRTSGRLSHIAARLVASASDPHDDQEAESPLRPPRPPH